MKHALGEPLSVAKINEDDTAVVAGGIDPSDERDSFADVGFADFVAMMGAHGLK